MKIMSNNELFLLEEIIKKNFSAKYKESTLGILWSILKPLLVMILLTIIFSTIFRGSIDNYPVYFLAGKCIYDFFSASTSNSLMSLKANGNILKRTAAPKYVFIIGDIISEFINFIITLVILVGVMIVTNAPFYFNTIPLSVIPIIFLIMMMTGIGLILSVVCVYYSDIAHLWGVVLLLLMYASAVFYPMEIIPEPFHQIMVLNPFFWIIDLFRHFAIWGTMPDLLYVINTFIISAIILVLGIIIFRKYEKRIPLKI